MHNTEKSSRERETETIPAETVLIRRATPDDIPRILELYEELVITASQIELGRNPSADDYREAFVKINAVPGLELLVAEYQGEVLGTMFIFIVPNLSHRASPWLLIENMVVDHRYRGRQLGKTLMEYALARARETGCYRVMLTSNKKRRRAHKFYRAMGFEASSYGFNIRL